MFISFLYTYSIFCNEGRYKDFLPSKTKNITLLHIYLEKDICSYLADIVHCSGACRYGLHHLMFLDILGFIDDVMISNFDMMWKIPFLFDLSRRHDCHWWNRFPLNSKNIKLWKKYLWHNSMWLEKVVIYWYWSYYIAKGERTIKQRNIGI